MFGKRFYLYFFCFCALSRCSDFIADSNLCEFICSAFERACGMVFHMICRFFTRKSIENVKMLSKNHCKL